LVLIQSSNEFKIHLKILLKNSKNKKKGIFHSLSFLPRFQPASLSFPAGPTCSSNRRRIGRSAQPAQHRPPATRRPISRATAAAFSFPPLLLTAWPRPSEPSPTSARPAPAPSHDATAAPTPRRGSVSPRVPCLYKKGAEPFPAPPAASPRSNRRVGIAVVLRPLLTVVRRPRFIPASDFRPW